ncbi:hypothetical protein DPEC_G00179950 [Dallia pectoralis]|uniref:Uncharacterized protein n=1 Tax=Dallia pectoralis TaxID=75939 RepID=A0ACC2GA44_DALPE|nr:hypothetical protein DPEC_G00179950 [Dallia pectoralis]
MELPFSGLELTFIIIVFIIFSLSSLASVCTQPDQKLSVCEEKSVWWRSEEKHRVIDKLPSQQKP